MPRYKIDEIINCGIECEDGKQFEVRETVSGEYIADEITVDSSSSEEEEPEYYRSDDFNLLIEAIIGDHGSYTCLDAD